MLLFFCAACHQPSTDSAAKTPPIPRKPTPAKTPPPTLVFDSPRVYKHVYEEVWKIGYQLKVKNTGDAPVRIEKVKSDCGCTVAKLKQRELAPGEETSLSVIYDVASKFGELPERKIWLITAGPNPQVASCKIAGFRQQRFRINPAAVDFGVVRFGSASSQTLSIDVNDPRMRMRREVYGESWLSLQVLGHDGATSETGERLRLTVGLNDNAPIGQHRGRLFIPSQADPELGAQVTVTAEVRGPLRLNPPIAFLGIMNSGRAAEATVKVEENFAQGQGASGRGFQIKGFTNVPAGLQLLLDKDAPSVVIVKAEPGRLALGAFEHRIVVQARLHDGDYDIELPVRGLVLDAH